MPTARVRGVCKKHCFRLKAHTVTIAKPANLEHFFSLLVAPQCPQPSCLLAARDRGELLSRAARRILWQQRHQGTLGQNAVWTRRQRRAKHTWETCTQLQLDVQRCEKQQRSPRLHSSAAQAVLLTTQQEGAIAVGGREGGREHLLPIIHCIAHTALA